MINLLKYYYYMYYRPKIFFPKTSYSTFGEDLFISKFFKNKKKGFYVDVGCYHPIVGSNTQILFKKKWNGINVDVSPLSVELFKKARPKDININLAVSDKKGVLKLYFRKQINMLNTTNKDIAKKHFKNGFKVKKIKSDTLNSILDKSNYKNRKIDFLNLDVEGNELNVLKSLNFKKYVPTLICVEIHNQEEMYNRNKQYLKKNKVYKFLTKKNYKIIWNKDFSFILKKK